MYAPLHTHDRPVATWHPLLTAPLFWWATWQVLDDDVADDGSFTRGSGGGGGGGGEGGGSPSKRIKAAMMAGVGVARGMMTRGSLRSTQVAQTYAYWGLSSSWLVNTTGVSLVNGVLYQWIRLIIHLCTSSVVGAMWYYPSNWSMLIALISLELALAVYNLCLAKTNDRLMGFFSGLETLISAIGVAMIYIGGLIGPDGEVLVIMGHVPMLGSPLLFLLFVQYDVVLINTCERLFPTKEPSRDGKLSLSEFRLLVRELRTAAMEDAGKRAEEALRDSTVEGGEGGLPVMSPQISPPPLSRTGETVGEVFRRFDVDNSDDISVKELEAALKALGIPLDGMGAAEILSKYDEVPKVSGFTCCLKKKPPAEGDAPGPAPAPAGAPGLSRRSLRSGRWTARVDVVADEEVKEERSQVAVELMAKMAETRPHLANLHRTSGAGSPMGVSPRTMGTPRHSRVGSKVQLVEGRMHDGTPAAAAGTSPTTSPWSRSDAATQAKPLPRITSALDRTDAGTTITPRGVAPITAPSMAPPRVLPPVSKSSRLREEPAMEPAEPAASGIEAEPAVEHDPATGAVGGVVGSVGSAIGGAVGGIGGAIGGIGGGIGGAIGGCRSAGAGAVAAGVGMGCAAAGVGIGCASSAFSRGSPDRGRPPPPKPVDLPPDEAIVVRPTVLPVRAAPPKPGDTLETRLAYYRQICADAGVDTSAMRSAEPSADTPQSREAMLARATEARKAVAERRAQRAPSKLEPIT